MGSVRGKEGKTIGSCGTGDAVGQPWAALAPPAPFMGSGRTRLTSAPGQGLLGANFKRGRNRCSSELIFPCGSCSPHYSGHYLSSRRSSLVVRQLREGLSARG